MPFRVMRDGFLISNFFSRVRRTGVQKHWLNLSADRETFHARFARLRCITSGKQVPWGTGSADGDSSNLRRDNAAAVEVVFGVFQ
jgi:hypothetical protein